MLRDEEVPSLRKRFAALAGVGLSQCQPLKVSRYCSGERFDCHTDAIRGDLRGGELEADDWFADRRRARHGVPGAPFPGVNRIATIFVYLNTVARGGRTRWRWLDYDACEGGSHGARLLRAARAGGRAHRRGPWIGWRGSRWRPSRG